jgi:hypothetical protein
MDEMTLRAFREGRGVRRLDVAAWTGVSYQRVQAIERAPVSQLLIGTLDRYVAAAGGRLLVGAEVPGDVVVPLFWRPAAALDG